MPAILIIEDDLTFAQLLERFLTRHDFSVEIAADIKLSKGLLQKKKYDLVLLDYRLPDGLGMEILTFLHSHEIVVPTIIMTSFHDIRTAVKTIRLGAYDYITKPVNPDELLLVVQTILKDKKQPLPVAKQTGTFIEGKSSASKKLNEYIALVAPTDFSVIIQGDNGTGKELAARSIHDLSKRKDAPFVALDCGALSSDLAGSELFGHVKGAFTGAVQNKTGQFQEANGGTLFLDEVGNLDYEIQVKLLRALQEHEIQPVGGSHYIKTDVRIICATNENLIMAVKNGKFREDLYHRLNEFTLTVPSLQERKEDIAGFITYFIDQTNSELGKEVRGVTQEVYDLFLKYDWPGNVRELKNVIKRSLLLARGNEITFTDLPREMILSVDEPPQPLYNGLRAVQADTEKEMIIKTLEQVKYNKSKAAKLLNIDRTTLYYKMSKYKISTR